MRHCPACNDADMLLRISRDGRLLNTLLFGCCISCTVKFSCSDISLAVLATLRVGHVLFFQHLLQVWPSLKMFALGLFLLYLLSSFLTNKLVFDCSSVSLRLWLRFV